MAGVALALVAALAWALGAIVIRLAMEHLRPTTGTMVSLLSGLAITMAGAVALHRGEFAALSAGLLLSLAVYGAVNFPVGRFFNFSSVRLLGVSRATPVLAAAPVVSMALAVLFLGETLTLPVVVGAAAVVAGISLIVSEAQP